MSKPKRIERLLFIFNAESGLLSTIADSAKKLLSINGCALCSLTHAMTGEKSEWRSCKESIGVPIEYLHRDELTPGLRRIVGNGIPCVAAEAGGETIVLLGSDVIARCKGSIPDFRGRLITYAAMHGLQLLAPEAGIRE